VPVIERALRCAPHRGLSASVVRYAQRGDIDRRLWEWLISDPFLLFPSRSRYGRERQKRTRIARRNRAVGKRIYHPQRCATTNQDAIDRRSNVRPSNSGSGYGASLREPIAGQRPTPMYQMETNSSDEQLKGSCASPPEHTAVGSLRLFRAPRRCAGFFCTPPFRGVSIRMNRSRRDGNKTVDYDAGRFSSPLDRHYSVAPANRASTCELSAEIDFLAMEFPPNAFEEHLGDRDDLGRLHTAFQRDELVMHLVERLWRERGRDHEAGGRRFQHCLGDPSGSCLTSRFSKTASAWRAQQPAARPFVGICR